MNFPVPDGFEIIEQSESRLKMKHRELGRIAIVRELTLGRANDWKQLELFERHIKTLRNLDHPGVPKVIGAFRGTGDVPQYFLATDQPDGRALSELIDEVDASRLRKIAGRVLQILEYLQSFSPAVVHRDITPEAIIVTDEDRVSLVEFGAVQIELAATVGGSTMVGTTGYMAPEQLLGNAVAASDLYALGAVLVHCLTGVAPALLPTHRMRLQWRDRARFGGSRFLDLVDHLVDPNPTERIATATEALAALRRTAAKRTQSARGADVQVAAPAAVDIHRTDRALELTLDTGKLSLDVNRGYRVQYADGAVVRGPLSEAVAVETGFRGKADELWLLTAKQMLRIGGPIDPHDADWVHAEIRSFLRQHW